MVSANPYLLSWKPIAFAELLRPLRRVEADAEDDHVVAVPLDLAALLVGEVEAARLWVLLDVAYAAPDELDSVLVLGARVVVVELLAEGAYVHEEYASLEAGVVLLRDDCLLYGVHAADAAAVGVAHAGVPATDTL